MKRLILILNGKGGVGKSFFAVNYVQFLKDKGIAHVAIDSDNENSTLKRFHPETLFFDLNNGRILNGAFIALAKTDLVVVDFHLIRDLNEDVFKEPFNIEFKELVGKVAALLKPMIETIDRFGLKTRFLRKHKPEVDRFFKWLSCQKYRSETALKCQQRLEKNHATLFTFLDRDDVPWNNNNAEHAVKAFAMLRRDLDGLSNENGIKEYLVLLSVCQTCKYMGVDFLDFLRSGEKDIHAFAESRHRRKRQSPTCPRPDAIRAGVDQL